MLAEVAVQLHFVALNGIERPSIIFKPQKRCEVKLYDIPNCLSLVGFGVGWFWVPYGLYCGGVPSVSVVSDYALATLNE